MANNTVFDDAYKTLIEKYPNLIIPIINEQFGRHYAENEKVENLSQELQKPQGDIAADSIFRIKNRMYHVECQSNPDATMAVRMLEYDFYAAMRDVANDETGQYYIDFPKSAVLYLRHNSNTPGEMSVKVRVSEDVSFDYKVPIIKTQIYSLDEILTKKLYLLLPFYLLRYEKETKQIETDANKLREIVEEYRDLIFKLDETCENEEDSKRLQVYELERQMKRIVEYIFEQDSKARNEIGGTIMGGTVMKTIGEEIEELKSAIKEKDDAIKEKDDAIKEIIKEKDDAIKEKDDALKKAMAEIERLKNQK